MTTRAALVTGGSGAIGLAMARVIASEGFGLTICANDGSQVQAGLVALRKEGADVVGHVADVAVERDVIETLAAHRRRWGRLDLLVNNAGVAYFGPTEAMATSDVDRLLAINLRGAILATREGLPLLREAGAEHGRAMILNMASISGKRGVPRLAVYGATKRALIELSRAIQLEAGRDGVRCTALAPSLVDTPMTDLVKGEGGGSKMIRPEDVAEAVRFLLRLSPGCHVPELVFTGPGPPPPPFPPKR